MLRLLSRVVVLMMAFAFLTGCDEPASAPASQPADPRVAALEARLAQLEAEVGSLKGGTTARGSTSAGAARDAAANAVSTSAEQPVLTAAPVQGSGPANEAVKIVENPGLVGRMGRIVVAFPKETKAEGTSVVIRPAGDPKKQNASGYGDTATDLLPGRYDVIISSEVVANVEVRSKFDSQIPVGVLRVNAGKDTGVTILAADGKKQLKQFYGSLDLGLPIGKYHVSVAGQSMPVEVKLNEVTSF